MVCSSTSANSRATARVDAGDGAVVERLHLAASTGGSTASCGSGSFR